MRFAIDACVPNQLMEMLKRLGADVITSAGSPAMPDVEALAGAFAADRVLPAICVSLRAQGLAGAMRALKPNPVAAGHRAEREAVD